MTQYLHTLVLTDSKRAATDEALAHFIRYIATNSSPLELGRRSGRTAMTAG